MQPIQDKELDQLFKNVFKNAEIEPSKDLWDKINPENIKGKKVKKLPLLWMAAASIVALITINLFFKEDKIQLSSGYDQKNITEIKPNIPKLEEPTKNDVIDLPVLSSDVVRSDVKTKIKTEVIPAAKTQEIVEVLPKQKIESEIVLAQQNTIELPVNSTNEVVFAQANTEVVALNNKMEEDGPANNAIRNVGDLVNFVVGKIDKREQKAIKFKTEDDESSIIGINIGFLKFNSRKK